MVDKKSCDLCHHHRKQWPIRRYFYISKELEGLSLWQQVHNTKKQHIVSIQHGTIH